MSADRVVVHVRDVMKIVQENYVAPDAVAYDRLRRDADRAAVNGLQRALPGKLDHAVGDLFLIVQHRTGLAPRDELALRRIGTVGKGFGDDR